MPLSKNYPTRLKDRDKRCKTKEAFLGFQSLKSESSRFLGNEELGLEVHFLTLTQWGPAKMGKLF